MKSYLPAIALLVVFLFPFYAQAAPDRTRVTPNLDVMTTQQRVQTEREKIRAHVASREAELKNKLQQFRDRRKATVVSEIDINLTKINQNRTDMMGRYLDTMTTILTKVETRTGQNASASAAVVQAKIAIQTAKDAVANQAAKTYTVNISSESRTKVDAKAARDSLHKDLQATFKLVVAAKQAVAEAIRSLASTSGQPVATRAAQPVRVPKEGTNGQ